MGNKFRLQSLGWKQARCRDAHREISHLKKKITKITKDQENRNIEQREMWIFKNKTAKATGDSQQDHKDAKHREMRHIPQAQQEGTASLWACGKPSAGISWARVFIQLLVKFTWGALYITDFLDLFLKDVVDFVWKPTHWFFWEAS